MARRTRTAVLGGAALVAGAAAVALTAAGRRWDRATARAVARLPVPAPDDTSARTYDPAHLAEVPAPVRRYFAFALTPGQRIIERAHVEHAGEFALEPDQWKPFTSVQAFSARLPGFVWDARMSMRPIPLSVRVRDSYVEGVGASHAAVAAVVPVGGQEGTPEIASSALWRYLAESVWFPTALLPSAHLVWTAIDDSTARATLSDRGATATATFHFDPGGAIARVTGTRYRAVGRGQVLTPTVGRHGRYVRIGGMMIPTEGEVAWLLSGGPHVYWRARVVRVTYDDGSPR